MLAFRMERGVAQGGRCQYWLLMRYSRAGSLSVRMLKRLELDSCWLAGGPGEDRCLVSVAVAPPLWTVLVPHMGAGVSARGSCVDIVVGALLA